MKNINLIYTFIKIKNNFSIGDWGLGIGD